MRARAVVHERRTTGWMPGKSLRALMLVCSLLAVSLAVNASIILIAGTRF